MTEIHAFDPDGTPSPGAEAGVSAIMATTLDPEVASLLGTGTATRTAVEDAVAPMVGVVDSRFASLEDALAACAPGGTLEVREAWTRTTAWVIDKPVTVAFRGGTITSTTHGIAVAASSVTIDSPILTGTGADTAGTAAAIRAVGTNTAPLRELTITHPTLTGWNKYGIYLEHVHGFSVTDPAITHVAYGGVMMLSCQTGKITGGFIRDITMPTGFVNGYGIAMTRNSSLPIATAPRTSDVTVQGVTVDGVPRWEGIDTHAGQGLRILGNTVLNCNVGIALVGCLDETGVERYAPLDVICSGNTIDSKVSDGSRSQGIQVVGAGSEVGNPIEAASSIVVTGNTILGHGAEGAQGTGGAVVAYCTRGAVISDNVLIRPGFAGINIYHSNTGLILANNVVEDVWSDSMATSCGLLIRSSHNEVTVAGTQITRGSKSATHINARGLSVSTQVENKVVDGGSNTWENATLASSGAANVFQYRVSAPLMGFYGADPVSRPGAIASPAADAASIKVAVDQIRAALKSLGLTA